MNALRLSVGLALGLFVGAAGARAQENQGQMGTQPRPAVTIPATQAHPEKRAEPTTPTTPQTKPAKGSAVPEQTSVEKPESAVGGTQTPAPQAQGLPQDRPPQSAGALQLVQPDAQELRSRIETALRQEPSLSDANIVLTISDAMIDITGNANTPRQRLTARRIVQSFAGNRKVQERITVAGMAPTTEPATTKSERVIPENAPAAQEKKEEPKPDSRHRSDPAKQGDASNQPR